MHHSSVHGGRYTLTPSDLRTPSGVTSAMSAAAPICTTSTPARPDTTSEAISVTSASDTPGGSARWISNRRCAISHAA